MMKNLPCSNNTWTYQNGELYHYGRPGMEWGKNIFGGIDNPKSLTYDPNYGKVQRKIPSTSASERVISKINNRPKKSGLLLQRKRPSASAAERIVSRIPNSSNSTTNDGSKHGIRGGVKGDTVRIGPNEFTYVNDESSTKNKPKTSLSDLLINKTRDKYTSNQIEYNSYEKPSNMTYLESNMAKQMEDGKEAYTKMVDDPSLKNMFNLAIQNAQYDIASGANDIVNKLGIGDKVNKLIHKVFGDSVSQRKRPSASAAERIADRIPSSEKDPNEENYRDEKDAEKKQQEEKDHENWVKAYEAGLKRGNPIGNNKQSKEREKINRWQNEHRMPYITVSSASSGTRNPIDDEELNKQVWDRIRDSGSPYAPSRLQPSDSWYTESGKDSDGYYYNSHKVNNLSSWDLYEQYKDILAKQASGEINPYSFYNRGSDRWIESSWKPKFSKK